MFKVKDYVNFSLNNNVTYQNQAITLPIKVVVDYQKIEKDLEKMRKILHNFRDFYGKDLTLVVTEDSITIEVNQ